MWHAPEKHGLLLKIQGMYYKTSKEMSVAEDEDDGDNVRIATEIIWILYKNDYFVDEVHNSPWKTEGTRKFELPIERKQPKISEAIFPN